MARDIQHFPPVGSDDRFDAIVAKGRRIRHRRQALFGATSGSVVAACIALALVFTGGNKPAKSGPIFADDGQKDASSTTVPQTTPPDEMRVTVDRKGDALEINVEDPRTPVPTDPASLGETSFRTQQCVLVTLDDESGQPAAEGYGCRDLTAGTDAQTSPVTIQLSPSDGLSVGCSAVEERSDPVATGPQQVSSMFSAELPSTLAAGSYHLTVEAVSGFGDGCPDSPDSTSNQSENTAAVKSTVTVSP